MTAPHHREPRRPGRGPRHRPVLPRRDRDQRGAAARRRAVPGPDARRSSSSSAAAAADRGIGTHAAPLPGGRAGTAPPPTPTPTSAGRSSSSGPSTAPTCRSSSSATRWAAGRRCGRAATRRWRPCARWRPGRPRVSPSATCAARRSRSCTDAATGGCRRSCRPTSPCGPTRPAPTWPGSPRRAATRCSAAPLRWHRFARDVVLGATGIEPMRADIANALQRPVPEGLAVPL